MASILPSLNLKTARSWRAIVAFTHLAREGRMRVIIGRRELLAALGGAAAWPLTARTQQPAKVPLLGYLTGDSDSADSPRRNAFCANSDTGKGKLFSLSTGPRREARRGCLFLRRSFPTSTSMLSSLLLPGQFRLPRRQCRTNPL